MNRDSDRIRRAFDKSKLAEVCVLPERAFANAYDLSHIPVDVKGPEDFYNFRDNGSRILAVAHLDTVAASTQREANFVETSGGTVVHSRALDDRLGAYIILDLLPSLGLDFDILLTVGEEMGQSTAQFFDATHKEYDWMIEFDRGGTDVVMYDYEDEATRAAVRRCGARVGDGIFSDISYMEHVGVKGFNWGVGYQDYHGPRAHAYLEDTYKMVGHFLRFHRQNDGIFMPHEERPYTPWWQEWTDEDPDPDFDDTSLTRTPVLYDEDYNEYPTLEDLRALERRLDYEASQRILREA